MRKLLLAGMMTLIVQGMSYADHLFGINASNITRGSISNTVLDPSSVTLKGGAWPYYIEISTSNLESSLSQRTLIANDEGSGLTGGNVTSINIIGDGAVASQVGSTVTVSIAGAGSGVGTEVKISSSQQTAWVIVGTSPVRGANIIGSRTEVFEFAIASASLVGGKIFVQSGDYYFNKTSTPSKVHMVFESSAVVKWRGDQNPNTLFYITSSTIEGLNVDIVTSVYVNDHNPLLDIKTNSKIKDTKISVRIENGVNAKRWYIVTMRGAINSIVENITFTSYTYVDTLSGTPNLIPFFIDVATNCMIINPIVIGKGSTGKNTGHNIFDIGETNGVDIIGGLLEINGDVVFRTNGVAGNSGFVKGFRMSGARINNYGTDYSNGIFYFETNTGMSFSSGNIISNITILNEVTTSQPIINPGAGGGGVNNIMWDNIVSYHSTSGNTGGGMGVASGTGHIFTNNKIWGTTGCFADGGVNTRWTGNDNFCNGTEQ